MRIPPNCGYPHFSAQATYFLQRDTTRFPNPQPLPAMLEALNGWSHLLHLFLPAHTDKVQPHVASSKNTANFTCSNHPLL